MSAAEPIAIVGMAARFPSSPDIDAFWTNLLAGRDCLTELSDEELFTYQENPETTRLPTYVRKRPVLPDSDAFDHRLFGMTPRDAELRDPQYRIMLESVHAALEHAGYDPGRRSARIGLFAGTNVNRYRYDYIERRSDVMGKVGFLAVDIGNHADYMATSIAYKLGLRGPAATVLTACSSALVAVHMAGNAIRVGDCDMAVAGGVDLEFPYHRGYRYLEGGILARDGTVRAFDANATGTNFGDGVGCVVLKPLDAALRDGDTVYATILASAVNNDGDRKLGYTAPSVEGQSECIRRALRDSGVHPRDIRYVEAHGTGTRVGDPIELAGLADAYRAVSSDPLPKQYCAITSVKSNIGHLGQAAGIASLIKAALVLTHRRLPPSINVDTPNPDVDWENSPFYLHTELADWETPAGLPRYAGVSSFGIGGTNAHMVLREPPERPATATRRGRETVVWSAVDDEAERALRESLTTHLAELSDEAFPDTAFTLRVGRTPRSVRGGVLADSPGAAASAIADDSRILRADGEERALVFAFPGQGVQQPGMCHDLYEDEALFRQGCDAAFEVLEPLLGIDLRALWRGASDPEALTPTEVAQPLLYVLEYTLSKCLTHWGAAPDVLIGHSVGELAAAAVAGVFGFEDGLRAVAARARCMGEMPPGRMLAVRADEAVVAGFVPEGVSLAAVNGAESVVFAGPADAIEDFARTLRGREIPVTPLATSHAFHSPAMAGAVVPFAAALEELKLYPPTVPVISAATGDEVSPAQAMSPQFWADQLHEPVRFDRAAAEVFAGGPANVVEVGPGRTLTGLLRTREDARAGGSRWLPTTTRDGKHSTVDEVLARLWVDAVPIDFQRVDEARGYRRVAAPGYPYQRRRFWVDRLPEPAPRSVTASDLQVAPATPATDTQDVPVVRAAPPATARRWRLAELDWVRDRSMPSPVVPAVATGAAVLLAPGDSEPARRTMTALQRAGYRTVRATDSRYGDSSATTIDPTAPADWLRLLDRVAERTGGPVLFVHAGLLEAEDRVDRATLERQLAIGLDAVHGAVRAAAEFRRRRRLPTRVVVLGRALVAVTGSEPVNAAGAAVLGLLRTAEREVPGLECHALDLAGEVGLELLADTLHRPGAPTIALRGSTRWLPRLSPLPDGGPPPRLRPDGTYLITGGLGGIGLTVARTLAETGLAPRLALLGRSGLSGAAGPAREHAAAAVERLGEAGAQVEVLAADVADVAALERAVRAVERRFGQVHGVVHAAGVPGGGLLERRETADVRRVLSPKTYGVLALDEVFGTRPQLDFLALFSSQAGLAGLYGSADYAAANAFLDAYARQTHAGERLTVSVQWPGWAEVGMLSRSAAGLGVLGLAADAAGAGTPANRDPADPVGTRGGQDGPVGARGGGGASLERTVLEVVRAPGRDWEFDEHLFDGVPVLPGTALLELAVLAARESGVPGEGRPLELRDVVFFAPVIGDRPRRLRVVVGELAGVHRFRVQSRSADEEGMWTDHVTGTFRPGGAVDQPDLVQLEESLPRETDVRLAGWMRFGPRWESMCETRGHGDERLARLVLPERYRTDLAGHPVHPALLDVAAGLLSDVEPGHQYAPFMYRRVTVFGSLTADLTVHARYQAGSGRGRRPVDFDLFDTADHRLLLRAESFVIREVSHGLDPSAATRRSAPAAAEPARPASAGTPTATHTEPGGLLSPEDGAALFLEILGRRDTPVVLIDSTREPIRLAGLPWDESAADPAVTAVRPAREHVSSTDDPVPASTPRPRATPAAEDGADAVPPGDEDVIAVLRRLWGDVLGETRMGLDDDFFDLGGDSLSAVQVAARISARFGIEVSAGSVLDFSTLRALGEEVVSQLGTAAPGAPAAWRG